MLVPISNAPGIGVGLRIPVCRYHTCWDCVNRPPVAQPIKLRPGHDFLLACETSGKSFTPVQKLRYSICRVAPNLSGTAPSDSYLLGSLYRPPVAVTEKV